MLGGAGGAGAPSPGANGSIGSNGEDSSFGSLFIMPGASGGGRGNVFLEGSLAANTSYNSLGGPSIKLASNSPSDLLESTLIKPNTPPGIPGIGYGGYGSLYHITSSAYSVAFSGMPNQYATTQSNPRWIWW